MKIKKEVDGSYSIPVDLNWSNLMMINLVSRDFRKKDKGDTHQIDELILKVQESLVILEDELKKV